MLRQSLAGVVSSHPLLVSIRQKLFLSSTLLPLADGLVDMHQSQLIERLAQALRDGRQVQLIRYQSANSNTIADRVVEPLSFTDDFATLDAYEPATSKVKTFKTRRIEDVVILDSPMTYQAPGAALDLFGWSGEPIVVRLVLSNRAYRLLIEDYPLAKPYTAGRKDDSEFPYAFEVPVRDWRGIGRFVLGLPGEVRVEEPDTFREYLRERIREFKKFF